MPKIPTFTLAWSPARETYELFETRDRKALEIAPDDPAWFTWLDQVSSFAFVGQSGHFSACKEVKQHGGRHLLAGGASCPTKGDDTAKMVSRFPIAQEEDIIHPGFSKAARDRCFKENGIFGFSKLVR